ncbi:MAG: FAD-dependent oxidoreductase [Promethearchaeota archaeon]
MNAEKKKVIVIGGDAAGLSAASAVKRAKKEWDVVVYEKGTYISYAACGIPYFVGDLVKEDDDLITITREVFLQKRNIPVKINHEVIRVNFDDKTVIVKDLEANKEFSEGWDHLVITTGARPRILPIPGSDLPNIFSIRGLDTGVKVKSFIKEKAPRSACIIGGGFIGLEMCEGFKDAGIENITLLEVLPRLLPNFPEEISTMVKDELEANGVKVIFQRKIKSFEDAGDGKVAVNFDDGNDPLIVDLVLMATGVVPNTDFLKGTPLKLDNRGAIDVDKHMRTNIENVWAAGDCANVNHVLLNTKVYAPLATIANKQGRYAGYNIVGNETEFPGTMGTMITKVFNKSVSRTGLTLDQAKKMNHDAVNVNITHEDMARYFPGASKLFFNVVVDVNSHVILGASICGSKMAAKKIDVLVALIAAKMKVEDIQMLDFSYAPPFAPVYDALLIIASVARKKVK